MGAANDAAIKKLRLTTSCNETQMKGTAGGAREGYLFVTFGGERSGCGYT